MIMIAQFVSVQEYDAVKNAHFMVLIVGALYGVDCGSSTNAFEMIEAVEKWAKENPQKYKVSRVEYDILEPFTNRGYACCFFEYDLLMSLLKKGYFKGADEKMNIEYYFYNCEVEER